MTAHHQNWTYRNESRAANNTLLSSGSEKGSKSPPHSPSSSIVLGDTGNSSVLFTCFRERATLYVGQGSPPTQRKISSDHNNQTARQSNPANHMSTTTVVSPSTNSNASTNYNRHTLDHGIYNNSRRAHYAGTQPSPTGPPPPSIPTLDDSHAPHDSQYDDPTLPDQHIYGCPLGFFCRRSQRAGKFCLRYARRTFRIHGPTERYIPIAPQYHAPALNAVFPSSYVTKAS